MIRILPLLALLALAVPATAQEARTLFSNSQTAIVTLKVRSTTDIAIMAPALSEFTRRFPDIAIDYEQWGSNDLYQISREACENHATPADAVLSSAVHQLADLVNRACAYRYSSPITDALQPARVWRDELWGLTQEPAVIIYNTDLVPEQDVPRSRFQLLDLMRQKPDTYRGKIATYDIEASGLGYLFAFYDSLEATTFGALLEGFARTGAIATCCSVAIIQGVAEGKYLIAYNVLGSYADSVPSARLGTILPEDYTLFLSRAYMIPRTARHTTEAARLLDFLLSAEGQLILRNSGLIDTRNSDDTGLPDSAKRPIVLNLPLLVASDQHRRASFVAQWRSAFAPQNTAPTRD